MTSSKQFDLTTIGNALVDVLAPVSDSFIQEQSAFGMVKGAMTLIDEARALELYELTGAGRTEMSGGSAGNTIAGFASFGGKGAYIGVVSNDSVGQVFADDLAKIGVHFAAAPLDGGPASGRCMIFVTEDGERTMNTFLGAATELHADSLSVDVLTNSSVTYMEGYLFDKQPAKDAYYRAASIARGAGNRVSLTLSDAFCVNRHREDFLDLIKNHTDILFANEDEIKALYETDDFDAAVAAVKGQCELVAITRSEKGSLILSGDNVLEIAAERVSKVLDTTGAGDQYAAGFLYGFTQGMSLEKCGVLGSMAASEVISHMGPRPLVSYKDFLSKNAA
jgi:sugar/nucleoside kinase (ribokinase family)